ncbi:MAG: nucleotidyltransferase domain-containing protein [Marinicellaceae bacterium]
MIICNFFFFFSIIIGKQTIDKKIKYYLRDLEKEKNIKILLACETGSRAWGFPSPDSDYDVRIIYQHDKDWYLTLNDQKDSVERMFENNDIDITGWDLRKCLKLLLKSNPALLERIQSHIIYQVDQEFLTKFNDLAKTAYSRISTAFHYFSMAKKLFVDVKDKEEFKLKRFFYVLRSAVACVWIAEKKDMPPIDFHKMMAGLELPESISKRIYELIDLKSRKNEDYFHSGEAELIDFIQEILNKTGKTFKSFTHSKANIEEFNQFFIHQLNK